MSEVNDLEDPELPEDIDLDPEVYWKKVFARPTCTSTVGQAGGDLITSREGNCKVRPSLLAAQPLPHATPRDYGADFACSVSGFWPDPILADRSRARACPLNLLSTWMMFARPASLKLEKAEALPVPSCH